MKTSILPTMALALQVDWLDAYGMCIPRAIWNLTAFSPLVSNMPVALGYAPNNSSTSVIRSHLCMMAESLSR